MEIEKFDLRLKSNHEINQLEINDLYNKRQVEGNLIITILPIYKIILELETIKYNNIIFNYI